MPINNYLLLLYALLLFSCKNNKQPNSNALNGKYDIKSAIIESEIDFLGMSKSKTILMFDDYGNKHKQIRIDNSSFLDDNKEQITYSLIDDKYIYIWEESKSKGIKILLEKNENDILAQRFNFKKIDEEFKTKYKLVQLEDKKIENKKCNVYQLQIDKSIIKYYIWNNIPLSFDLEMEGKTITSKLLSVNEKPKFKPSDFEIPKNILFEETSIDEQYTHQH